MMKLHLTHFCYRIFYESCVKYSCLINWITWNYKYEEGKDARNNKDIYVSLMLMNKIKLFAFVHLIGMLSNSLFNREYYPYSIWVKEHDDLLCILTYKIMYDMFSLFKKTAREWYPFSFHHLSWYEMTLNIKIYF